jgi:hypothetical protein
MQRHLMNCVDIIGTPVPVIVYCINKELFTSKPLSRSTILKLYNMVIKPVVT